MYTRRLSVVVCGLMLAACERQPAPLDTAPVAAELDAVLSPDGSLVGQRLLVGRLDGSSKRSIDLPAESFASRVHDGQLIFGGDDGSRSLVSIWSPADGTRQLWSTAEVVRHAINVGQEAFVYRVSRAERLPLGVVRLPLSGGAPVEAIPAIPIEEPYGKHFASTLHRSIDGDAVALESCGEELCRVRVLDLQSGEVTAFDATDQGALLGVTRSVLVIRTASHVLPAEVRAVDRRTREARTLAASAGLADVTRLEDGSAALAFEAEVPNGRVLRVVSVASGAAVGRDVPLAGSLVLQLAAPDGLIATSPEGRAFDPELRLLSVRDQRWYAPRVGGAR